MSLTYKDKVEKAERTLQEKKGGTQHEIGLAQAGVKYSKMMLDAAIRAAAARGGNVK